MRRQATFYFLAFDDIPAITADRKPDPDCDWLFWLCSTEDATLNEVGIGYMGLA